MKFYIIGIDDNSRPKFGDELMGIITRSRVFSGGVRHRQIVGDMLPEGYVWIDIAPPMNSLMARYDEWEEVVVFASGDPLFYGFASTLQNFRPLAQMEIYPTFNSLQILSHRAQKPYHNMKTVSLTGREWREFDTALINGERMIGVLTDTSKHTPRKIAERMLQYGYDNYTVTLGELLGNTNSERVREISVAELSTMNEGDLLHPCNMILEQIKSRDIPFGISDSEFMGLEGRSRMITKKAIRLTLLSMLDLHRARSFWDVGFCTGSVSIEAKLRFPHLSVTSFEKREECREIICHNMKRFGALGIEYHIGDFMECDTDNIASPDAIFIGGHGGNLESIIQRCAKRLRAGGVLILNSVTQKSKDDFRLYTQQCGLTEQESVEIKVDEHNTITIIKTQKADE